MTKTWIVVLYGRFTRDIRHVEVDAGTERQARDFCATEMPAYRVHSIALRQESKL